MKVLCIVNPAAGQDYPILAVLNRFFGEKKYDWDLVVTGKDDLPAGAYDHVVIYGGDGTVSEYLGKLNHSAVLILQGGTGNVISKAIGIPADPEEALSLLDKAKVKSFDSFQVNGESYFLRIFSGPPVEMLKNVEREDKNLYGLGAYVGALLKGIKHEPHEYEVEIDGEKEQIMTNLFFVANFSALGIAGIKIDSSAQPDDGELDLLCMDMPVSLLRKVQSFKKMTVRTKEKLTWSCDDEYKELSELFIEVIPESIKLIVP